MSTAGDPSARPALLETIARSAGRLGDDLAQRVLPYWSGALDTRHGGFVLADEATEGAPSGERLRRRLNRALGRRRGGTEPSPGEKHVVGQARAVHALALGSRLGFDPSGTALTSALAGAEFLRRRIRDARRGGFFWSVNRRGRPVRPEKLLYGQAFVILALTEAGRAAARADLVAEALALFRLVHELLHDDAHGGWREHATADFRPLAEGDRAARGLIDLPGRKSVNAHLHVLEALAELALATGDGGVLAALEEALAVCARFLPGGAAPEVEYLAADWAPLDASVRVRVGHVLEHAWLAKRAREALGRPAPADPVLAAVDRALTEFDWDLGGFVSPGASGRVEKEWWVQAEGVMALTAAVRLGERPGHVRALARQLAWIEERQRGPHGVWLAATDRVGRATNATLAGTWKAGYHEVRAAAIVAREFGTARARTREVRRRVRATSSA